MKKWILAIVIAVLLTGCGCDHEFVEATCTEPLTCAKCGESDGEALGHTWVEATYITPKSCVRCGLTEGEPLTSPYDGWEDFFAEYFNEEFSYIEDDGYLLLTFYDVNDFDGFMSDAFKGLVAMSMTSELQGMNPDEISACFLDVNEECLITCRKANSLVKIGTQLTIYETTECPNEIEEAYNTYFSLTNMG